MLSLSKLEDGLIAAMEKANDEKIAAEKAAAAAAKTQIDELVKVGLFEAGKLEPEKKAELIK